MIHFTLVHLAVRHCDFNFTRQLPRVELIKVWIDHDFHFFQHGLYSRTPDRFDSEGFQTTVTCGRASGYAIRHAQAGRHGVVELIVGEM